MTIQLFIAIIIVSLLCMALPFAVFGALKARLGLRWSVFGVGALTFFVSQVVLRLPWQIPLSKAALAHGWNTGWAGGLFGVGAAVTAGLFEETGRYFAYRLFVKRPTQGDAIALGIGHAGFESVALVGVSTMAIGIMLYLVTHGLVQLPADQAAALQPMLDKTADTAWYPELLVISERIFAMCGHVAMSVLVYFAYVRRRWLPFFGALALHVAMDASVTVFGKQIWAIETFLAIVGVICLWGVIRFWRRSEAQKIAG